MQTSRQEFYYHFKRINLWLMLNVFMSGILAYWSYKFPCFLLWVQTWILYGCCMFSWGLWWYKYIKKQRLALITPAYIAIDHCRPLYWRDIKMAEERIAVCGWIRRRVIVLIPKKNIKYHYNFLQRHNGGFTPFSIPLYEVLAPQDQECIAKIIASHTVLKALKTR